MIGIIGQGFVGNAIYQKFKTYFKVYTYDLDETKSNSTKEQVMSEDIVFVCLPTPMDKDGSAYTGIVEEAIKDISEYGKTKIAVIKSTVPPGTTEKLNNLYPT
jgi:3-hydroxyacyl-CoA dehydrogenase